MKINAEIVQCSSQYVLSYMEQKLPESYCYHNHVGSGYLFITKFQSRQRMAFQKKIRM